MDENTNLSQQAEETTDAFLDGWDDDSTETDELTDQSEQKAEETTEANGEKPEAEGQAQGAEAAMTLAEQAESAAQQGNADAQPADVTWNIKHMGEERTVSAKDITPELLQKGFDYDRVRTKYDEAKPIMSLFSDFAAKAGMSVEQYATWLRTEAKKAEGMSDTEAQRVIAIEDREAAVSAKEAEQQQAQQEQQAQQDLQKQSQAKVKADLAEFERTFPEIYKQAAADPKSLPQSVWDDVNSGLSITAAVSKMLVAQATQQTKDAQMQKAQLEQNQKNSGRSTGSMQSAGADNRSKDPFLDGFGA